MVLKTAVMHTCIYVSACFKTSEPGYNTLFISPGSFASISSQGEVLHIGIYPSLQNSRVKVRREDKNPKNIHT